MKCRFCGKEFSDFVELNKHELECYNAKCELERVQREKEEIARREAEDEKKLRDEINQRGKELIALRNEYVVEWNRFKKDFEHTKWFDEWKDMGIEDTGVKVANCSTAKTVNRGEDAIDKSLEEYIKRILPDPRFYFFD